MSHQIPASELLERWRAGDQQAATQIYDRYAKRLWALADAELNRRLRRRVDVEDVLQSVFRTFFRRTARGEYPIEQSGTLRHLLVRITLNKVRRQGEHHRAGKRNVSTEIYFPGDEADLELAAKEPAAADATLLLKDLEDLQTGLTPAEADMVRMCLEGYSPSEVAARTGLSRWTVRRILNRLGHRLRSQLN